MSAKELTPEEKAKRDERRRFLSELTNRQRLAHGFHALFHSQGRRLVYWRNGWWQWAGTHYNGLDKQTLRAVLTKFCEAEFAKAGSGKVNLTRTILGDVFGLLEAHCTADANREAPFSLLAGGSGDKQHISLVNGVLDVAQAADGAGNVFPHDPDWFSLGSLPFSYDPAATCPKWDRFLFETFEGDVERIAFIEEWLGYCCVYDYSYQHAVILTGDGANGKGVLAKVLVALVGPDNCSHVPLEMFGEKFALEPTLGKLVNSAPEISQVDKAAEEQLKAITGNDRVTVTIKYGSGINTRLSARLMFSTNELPFFQDSTGGLKRRLIIIPFDRVVPEGQRNARLHDELFLELPGIFNRALAGLRRLRQRDGFTIPAVSKALLERHMLESEPAVAFLDEHTTADPSVACPTMELYKAYRSWFEEQGFPRMRLLSQPVFAKEVARKYRAAGRQLRREGEFVRLYVGVRAVKLSEVGMVTA